MTTIAYRDGVLAADTLTTRGYTAIDGAMKVASGPHGLGGACGNYGFVTAWLEWVSGERAERPVPVQTADDTDVGLLITPEGAIMVYEGSGHYQIRAPYYAIGSGRDQALGAMHAGASAANAIRAAIEHDTYTGGTVTLVVHEGRDDRAS